MANVARPMGLRPVRYIASNEYNAQGEVYAFSTAQANDAYKGDLVRIDTTNRTASLSDPYMPAVPFVLPVVAALTTTTYRGVIVGFVPQPEFSQTATASLGTMFRQASTARYALIAEDVDTIFEVEESGNSYVTAANNGTNKVADLVYTAGSQVTGVSGVRLDGTTVSTGAVKPFRILRYTQRVNNFNFTAADTNAFAHWDVMINNSEFMVQASVGV